MDYVEKKDCSSPQSPTFLGGKLRQLIMILTMASTACAIDATSTRISNLFVGFSPMAGGNVALVLLLAGLSGVLGVL
jgi:hypothetical protein